MFINPDVESGFYFFIFSIWRNLMKRLFTSESVTEGHPDKICDQISDGVLDAIFEKDPHAHVACESFCTTGTVVIMGEISTSC